MGSKVSVLLKLIVTTLLISYSFLSDVSIYSNKVCAGLTLVFSILFLFKSRKNVPLFIVAFFIVYCNYSVILGEYFIGGNLGVPFQEVKTIENYGLSIRVLLIFTTILALFINPKELKLENFIIKPKDNIVIFYGLLLILGYILLFGINRGSFSSYTISITPLYEYSTILILFAYFSSGSSKFRMFVLMCFTLMFILQDFYYGGRITSLQLIFLFLITAMLRKLSIKLILIGGSIGIFVNSLVDVYRQNYSLDSINILGIINNLIDNFFVFNTPVYAFYSSATHVAAKQFIQTNEGFMSFFDFFVSIFRGNKNGIGDVTDYVSTNYFFNIGGGLIPTHFYFWFGWIGVIIAAIVVIFMLNRLGLGKSDYWKLITITIIFSVPRWYLYTPLNLFRPLLFVTVLYLIFTLVHQLLFKVAGEYKEVKEINSKPSITKTKKRIRITW